MANINFKYDYPYIGYGEKDRFQYQWSESRTTLNRCYTYPLLFNTAVPGCLHITMDIEIENTGSGTVLGRSWDFYIYRQNYGWYEVCSFTLPDDGKYTIDTDILLYSKRGFLDTRKLGRYGTAAAGTGKERSCKTQKGGFNR